MPYFAYKARNARGELLKGVVESADSNAVADQLLNTGVTPVEIVAARKPASATDGGFLQRLFEEKVRPMDVQLFSRQMYTLLKSGVPIFRGLAGLQESSINKSFARVLQDLRESLDSGRELSAAMRRHPLVFSSFYVSMVRVGEMTGRLDEIFLRLFNHLEFERDMRERIRSAMRYPSFVLVAMIIAMVVINMFVIPAFAKVYAGFHAQLPIMTRILVASSNFTVHFWPLLLVFAVGLIFGFRLYVGTTTGR